MATLSSAATHKPSRATTTSSFRRPWCLVRSRCRLFPLEPGRIPAAFWKLIAYVGEASKRLEVSAFLVFQDDESILKRRQVLGNNQVDPFVIYQSSTTLIEQLTGIEFPEVAFDNNPMLFFERRDEAVEFEEIVNTPELIEVSTPKGESCGIRFLS